MADMLPGTGRAGAAFPGKSGIIARSATWRKGREGGARGKERGRDKKTRRAQGLDWSGARRGCACGRHKYGRLPGYRKGDLFQIQKVMQQKEFFVKTRHGRKYPCPAKAFPGSGKRYVPGLSSPHAGRGHTSFDPDAGRRQKMRKLRRASAKGISDAGDDPACHRVGHGQGRACCPRGGAPGGEPHGPGARACWAGPCAAGAAVAGDGAAVAGRRTRDRCYAHSLSPGGRARRAGSGPGHAGA